MTTAMKPKEETKSTEAVPVRKEYPVFHSLQREMNRLFDEFTHGWSLPQFDMSKEFQAKVDVKETDKEIIVTAELPGVDLKDIDVSLRSDGLALRGEKLAEKEEKEKGYYRMERSYGSFYRLIPMPYEVDKDATVASYKDGVLKVTLPKAKEALKNEQKVQVKAG